MFKKFGLFFLTCAMTLAFGQAQVFGFEALGGDLEINGFLRNDSAIRLSDGHSNLHGQDVLVSTDSSTGILVDPANPLSPTNGLPNSLLTGGADMAEGFDSGDYSLCRNTLQFEVGWKMKKGVSLYGIWRGYYNAALEIDRDQEQRMIDAGSRDEIDDFERDYEMREIFIDITPGNWNFRIGKQQIIWGESDGFRMADIINPLDYSWHYFFPSWEDIRIPLWGVDIMYSLPSMNEYTFEFVWLPGAFNNGFQPNKLAPFGTNWSMGFFNQYFHSSIGKSFPGMDPFFPGFVALGTDNSTGTVQFFNKSVEKSTPDNSIQNSEVGMRINAMFGAFDVCLFDFYSRSDNPVFEKDWFSKFLSGVLGGNLYDYQDEIFQYPWVNKTGATFNVYEEVTETVFRGECVYSMDEPFLPKNAFPENATAAFTNSLTNAVVGTGQAMGYAPYLALPYPLMPTVDPGYTKTYYKDTFAYMLGFDRPTMIPWLNPTKSFFISGQVFQKYILDFDDDQTTMEQSHDDVQTLFTFLVNTGYYHNKIRPQVFMMYDCSGEGWVQPQVEFVYGNYWRFGIGANLIYSNNKTQGYFGGMRDNDDLYAWASFSW